MLNIVFKFISLIILASNSTPSSFDNNFAKAIASVLQGIAASFLAAASVIARLIDSFALRNPYPCYHNGIDQFTLVCGDGLKQPEMFPIVFGEDQIFTYIGGEDPPETISNHPYYSDPEVTAGFWGNIAEAHVFIVAVSIVLLVFGTAITYFLYSVGWGATKREVDNLGFLQLAKTSMFIILWWPIGSAILWIVEGFNVLMISFFEFNMESSRISEIEEEIFDETLIEYTAPNGESYQVPDNSVYELRHDGVSSTFGEDRVKVDGNYVTNDIFDEDTVTESEATPWGTIGPSLSPPKGIYDETPFIGASFEPIAAKYRINWEEVENNQGSYDSNTQELMGKIAKEAAAIYREEETKTAASSRVATALEAVQISMQSSAIDSIVGGGGSFMFIVIMIFLIIPYLLIGFSLVLIWLLRVMGLLILFVLMPIAIALKNIKFKGFYTISNYSEKALPLFLFLVIITIPVSLFGGLAVLLLNVMDAALSSIAGIPDFVQTSIFLFFIMWLPIIYGAIPFLLAKYTSFNPSREFDTLGGSFTNLKNYDVKSIAEGDSDKSLKENLKKGNIGGALESASGKTQSRMADKLGQEDSETVTGAMLSDTTDKTSQAIETAEDKTVDARTAFEEEGKTLENYKQRQEERAEKRTKKKARENKEEAKEQANRSHEEMLKRRRQEEFELEHLEEQLNEEDVYEYRNDLGNDVFTDIEEFDEEKESDWEATKEEMKSQLTESMKDGDLNTDQILRSIDSIDLALGGFHEINDDSDLGEAIRDSEMTIGEKRIKELEERLPDEELAKSDKDAMLVERLAKDGSLQNQVVSMMDEGKVEFTEELKEEKNKTFDISNHASEYGLDVQDITPDSGSLSDEALEETSSYEEAKTYQKALDKQSDRIAEESKDTVDTLLQVKGDIQEKTLENTKDKITNFIENEIEEMDGIDENASEEEKWKAYFERESSLGAEEIFEEVGIDKDKELFSEFISGFEEAEEEQDEDLENKQDLLEILNKAEENAMEETDIEIYDIEKYVDEVDWSEENAEEYQDVDSPEELLEKYNEDVFKKQMEMLGLKEMRSLEAAQKAIEKQGFNKEDIIGNFIDDIEEGEASESKKDKLYEMGKKIKEIEARDGVSVDDVLDSS